MEPTELRRKEVNRAAWRIFGLVRAKRDSQAVLELHALGEEMLPIAHALVLGDFRTTPIVKFGWYIFGAAFVVAPLLFTLTLYAIFGNPPFWRDSFEALIFYFGVFAATFLIQSCGAAVVMEARDRRLRKSGGALSAIHRTNEIASRALACASGKGAALVGALLDAGVVDSEPSAATRRKLDEALLRLLPNCLQDTLSQLNSSQRRALWNRLGRVVGVVRPATPFRTAEVGRRSIDEHHEAKVGIAILKVYEILPDEQAVGTVRALTTKSPWGRGAGWTELIEAAKHCLPILEEIVRRSRCGSELLRGSSDVASNGEYLLRSTQRASEGDGRELLRARSE